MTGYGKADRVFGNKKIVAEVRSLNSKQFDFNLRIPSLYRELEMEIRGNVSRVLQRGKVDMIISVENVAEAAAVPINQAIFSSYYNQIMAIANDNGFTVNPSELIPAILRLPDVLRVQREEVDPTELKVVLQVCNDAQEALNIFRENEGQVLEADMLKRVDLIQDFLKQMEPIEKQRIVEVRQRLFDALRQLQNDQKIDQNRFEQEVIYYLEKLDITEEKVRLRQHCSLFKETVKQNEPVGRKLGFIAQEMGREINTLGSKANNADIQKLVVQMKDELEKIKEQSLNIL